MEGVMLLNVYEFARKHFGRYKQKGSELIPELCIFCHGGDKRDKHTFALNVDKQTFNCKRGTCGRQGHFTELCREFGEMADREERFEYRPPVKNYKKPLTKIETPKERVEGYLKLRGFSKETWERRGVGESNGNIVFPYYENGELVMLKFRKPEKYNGQGQKAWRETGGRPILWGMDLCDTSTGQLVITEGEPDALALDECGIKNVVSVPSGAEDLTWIELCWDWLKQFDTITFWGDADEPGKRMIKSCIKRLSDFKIYVVNSPHKDANACLVIDGKGKVIEAVNTAQIVPRVGLLNLADVVRLDVRNMERVGCKSLTALNLATGGFRMGELSVWTGKSGEGKSTLLGQILLDSINEGVNVCAYSGELAAGQFQYWINLQAAGSKNINTLYDSLSGRDMPCLRKEIEQRILQWVDGRFWLCDNTATSTVKEETSIINLFTYAAKRYGCRVFLVDNLMTARFESKSDSDYYRQQSNFVGQLVSFAKTFNVVVHLVAHPRKTSNNTLEKSDVSGSSDIINRCDNAFAVSRNENSTTVKILKNRLFGAQNIEFKLNFDTVSKRFYGLNNDGNFAYGWENNNTSDDEFVQEVF